MPLVSALRTPFLWWSWVQHLSFKHRSLFSEIIPTPLILQYSLYQFVLLAFSVQIFTHLLNQSCSMAAGQQFTTLSIWTFPSKVNWNYCVITFGDIDLSNWICRYCSSGNSTPQLCLGQELFLYQHYSKLNTSTQLLPFFLLQTNITLSTVCIASCTIISIWI